MFALAAFGFAVGVVVGLRFKVLALVPAIAISLAAAAAWCLALHVDAWGSVLAGIVAAIAPQIGYLAASRVRSLLVARRSARQQRAGAGTGEATADLPKTR
jgi:hypothetical protein